jgi:hypothetical protein
MSAEAGCSDAPLAAILRARLLLEKLPEKTVHYFYGK